jgi:transposase
MLIVGYAYGIRSERRLCEEVRLNLAYRWFCNLGIEDGVPDHSTFSKNRHGRFRESDAFRHVFETVVHRRSGPGLLAVRALRSMPARFWPMCANGGVSTPAK